MTASKDDPEKFAGAAAPRAARFGEGGEGHGGRRERGVSAGSRDNAFERTGKFLHDTRAELKRVSWPTALQVRNTTIITIIAVAFFAAYLYGVDRLFTFLLEQVAKLVGAA